MQQQAHRRQRVFLLGLWALAALGLVLLAFLSYDRWSATRPSPDEPPSVASSSTPSPTAEPSVLEDAPPEPAEPTPTEPVVGIGVGQRAPDFSLPSLDGDEVSLSDFLGSVVILDFWASWCGPCKSTMPGLDAMVRALGSDVVLLGVSLDRTAEDATRYLSANSYDVMVAVYGSYAAASRVAQRYAVQGIPRMFLIDRDGIIRFVGHPSSFSRSTIDPLL
jgi:cytochrome c biogenesis protein CcmG, thiol:disulfide interchange protein DsbE